MLAGTDNARSPLWTESGIAYDTYVPAGPNEVRIVSPSGGASRTLYTTTGTIQRMQLIAPPPTGAVPTCGLLTRYASDGNLRLLTIQVGGSTTQYRLEQPGTAPPDLPTNQFVRLAGRRIPADSGNPQAVNLTDYTATPVTAC